MHSDKRLNALQNWLNKQLKLEFSDISPASSDASFRRYFRIDVNSASYIAMDAPPENESLGEFIYADSALLALNLHAPVIHAENSDEGFLLMEDLGTQTYFDKLNEQNADVLYSDAIDALITMQTGIKLQPQKKFPLYSAKLLKDEMQLFESWYLPKHINRTLSSNQADKLHTIYQLLIDNALEQPQSWVHRDYHSRNLMLTENSNPGIIDFQDMVIGGISYDLVSLFKDCYIAWPRVKVEEWISDYHKKYHQIAVKQFGFEEVTLPQLIKFFDLMGVQRHLKVLGIFSRLFYRDNKEQYLNDIPLVKQYLIETCEQYDELAPLADILHSVHSE